MAFPFLYNSRPRSVHLMPYHHPMLYYIKSEDPDLPAFYFDPLINPISAHTIARDADAIQRAEDEVWQEDEDDDVDMDGDLPFSFTSSSAFVLPLGIEPVLSERELYVDNTANGITLYWAPRPFNLRQGRTRRALDVPLVNAWFQEHCSHTAPVRRPLDS